MCFAYKGFLNPWVQLKVTVLQASDGQIEEKTINFPGEFETDSDTE